MSIFLFTNFFPFNPKSESFLETEIKLMGKIHEITVIPLQKSNEIRDISDNVKLNTLLCKRSTKFKIYTFFRLMLSPLLWKLPFVEDSPKSFREYIQALKYMYGAFLVYSVMKNNFISFKEDTVFYSYWFNHTPLGLAIYKMKHPEFTNVIISRAHGFDVYEREVGVYIPYRSLTLSYIDNVFVVSETGCSFLQNLYPKYKEKINIARLGVEKINSKIEKKQGRISFLSCSSIIPVKRVELIFQTINRFAEKVPSLKIYWTHIGNGSNMSKLEQVITETKDVKIQFALLGFMSNVDVHQQYCHEKYDVFVNLSLSEGVPVSIMEAISAGVPVIATNVGGNKEIVSNETGYVIPKMFDQEDFNSAMSRIISNAEYYNQSVESFYYKNYNAKKNYSDFYSNLKSKKECAKSQDHIKN